MVCVEPNRSHKNLVKFIICNALPALINIMITTKFLICGHVSSDIILVMYGI